MLRELFSTKDAAKVSPWLRKIDAAAVELVDVEQEVRAANDELFLARAAYWELTKSPTIAGSDGHTAYREDGTVVTRSEVQAAERRIEEADSRYARLSERLAAARGKLARLGRAQENWVYAGKYEADQAAARAAETPQERDARIRREIEQEILQQNANNRR